VVRIIVLIRDWCFLFGRTSHQFAIDRNGQEYWITNDVVQLASQEKHFFIEKELKKK